MVFAAQIIVAGAAIAAAIALWRVAAAVDRGRHEALVQQLLTMFAGASAAVQQDPRQLLVWFPIARNARKLFPAAFAQLDNAFGSSFPFSREQVQAAHARCSSEWLAWERAHDAEFSLKTAQLEEELARAGGQPSAVMRTRLAALEQQKLERYQQRYEDYIKTAKALAALID